MIDLSRVEKYYVACGYTDMRRGIDGLAAIVSQQFGAPLCEDSPVSVLRAADRPDQSAVFLRGWVCTALQAVKQWCVSVAKIGAGASVVG